ncbi:MAG: redoxin domain-containing protein [Verrucomicrobiota bacterium]
MKLPVQVSLLMLGTAVLSADEPANPLPGHSHQGEAFNEGPRQFATLESGFGDVHFPVATDWEDGQAFFNQGIGQLHGFLYFEAERTFRHIAAKDEDCAMAYWGMAMANWENEGRAKGFIEKAVERKEGVTPRERLYIDAQAKYLTGGEKDQKKRKRDLIRDYEAIVREHPDDIEARAFLACRIWQFSRKGIEIGSHEAVDALMDPVFAANPMHPAHHYRIHLWDKEKAEVALDSAHVLGETAPEIAHMWHMPTHIYSKLYRYDDAVWVQEASSRVDHRTMAEQRLLPDQIHNYAHNNEWMVRNLIYLGDREKALTVARSLVANPRHPKLNHPAKRNSSVGYGRMRLRETYVAFEMWRELLAESKPGTESPWLDAEREDLDWIDLQLARGLAQTMLRWEAPLGWTLKRVKNAVAAQEKKLEAARKEAREEAEEKGKAKKEIEKAIAAAAKPLEPRRKALKAAEGQLVVLQKIAGHAKTAGEDNVELELSDEEIKKLEKIYAPARAQLWLKLGEPEKALKALEKETPGQTLPLAAKVEVLLAMDRDKEAKAAFEELRKISFDADLTAPPLRRVTKAALAEKNGWIRWKERDWRGERPVRDDIRPRPDVESLGPIAWEPPAAPGFGLPDEHGKSHRLVDRRGSPVVLIFYLGHGCLHCIEQLNAFAPAVSQFEEAGIEIIAVSTDDVKGLEKSQEKYESADSTGQFPFQLLANPELDVFRSYRAYDDFEKQPLHGTFLIDPSGRILWSDTGPEPFSDPEFLLKESKRLLEIYPGKDVASR